MTESDEGPRTHKNLDVWNFRVHIRSASRSTLVDQEEAYCRLGEIAKAVREGTKACSIGQEPLTPSSTAMVRRPHAAFGNGDVRWQSRGSERGMTTSSSSLSLGREILGKFHSETRGDAKEEGMMMTREREKEWSH